MPRLPTPGSDDGSWGDILNDYLSQAHSTDGTLKPNVVTASQLAPSSVTASALTDGVITSTKIADGVVTNAKLDAPTKASLVKADSAVQGTDPRLTDSRSPTTHASSHATAGSDPITVAQSQVTNLTTDLAGKAATAHTHAASAISDSTAVGRSLITATDVAAAQNALSLSSTYVPQTRTINGQALTGDITIEAGGLTEPTPGITQGALVITFDDGTTDQYTNIFPVLASRGMAGTFFISANLVGTAGYMTAAQIVEMHEAGMEMASHGASHTTIAGRSESFVRSHFSGAKEYLATLGINARSHGYVGGSQDRQVRRIVGEYFDVARATTGAFPSSTDITAPASVFQSMELGIVSVAAIKAEMDARFAVGKDVVLIGHAAGAPVAADLGEVLDYALSIGMPVRTFIDAYDARVAHKYGTQGITFGHDGGIGAVGVQAEDMRAGGTLEAGVRFQLANPGKVFEIYDSGSQIEIQSLAGRPLRFNGAGNTVTFGSSVWVSGNSAQGIRFSDFPNNGIVRPNGVEGVNILSQSVAQVQARHTTVDDETGILVNVRKDGSYTLSRVTIGAPDSGGTGFRVLRVPN